MNKGFLAVAAVVVAVVGGTGWHFGSPSEPAEAAVEAVVMVDGVQDMTLGMDDAPVEIIEYASYTCPHCARFHEGPFKQLKTDYIDAGKVKFTYREVYFDRFGLWASMVARCGGEKKFFGITTELYAQQSEWARLQDPVAIADALRKIGRTAGMNNEQLDACLNDAEQAETLVAWFEANAARDGISSTPSFVIDGRAYSNMDFAEFQSIIDPKLN
jgi:protein-disulfide isomerase